MYQVRRGEVVYITTSTYIWHGYLTDAASIVNFLALKHGMGWTSMVYRQDLTISYSLLEDLFLIQVGCLGFGRPFVIPVIRVNMDENDRPTAQGWAETNRDWSTYG
jgi:hypothetical protein